MPMNVRSASWAAGPRMTPGGMGRQDVGMTETEGDPRRIIEKALWRHGTVGESCAVVAATILNDLDASGWAIVPSQAGG